MSRSDAMEISVRYKVLPVLFRTPPLRLDPSSATCLAIETPGEWAFRASVLGCEGALSGHAPRPGEMWVAYVSLTSAWMDCFERKPK